MFSSTELDLYLRDDTKNSGDDTNRDHKWGHIHLTVKLNPKTQEEREQYYGRGKWTTTQTADGPTKKVKSQPWDSVVYVLLVRGEHIQLEADYCLRFKLGAEKYKSKVR